MKLYKLSGCGGGILFSVFLFLTAGCANDTQTGVHNERSQIRQNQSGETSSPYAIKLINLASPPTPSPAAKLNIDEYWLSKLTEGHDIFGEITAKQDQQALCDILSEFGKHGASADFVILFSAPELNMPITRQTKIYPITEDEFGISGKDYEKLQLAACKCQVRNFIENPNLLSRYYMATVWNFPWKIRTNQGIGALAEATVDGFKEDNPEEYWWYARNALVLMEATRRTDLLNGAKPEDIKQRFSEWVSWFKNIAPYMVPNQNNLQWDISDVRPLRSFSSIDPPLKPFPDWEGESPTNEIVYGMYNSLFIPNLYRDSITNIHDNDANKMK